MSATGSDLAMLDAIETRARGAIGVTDRRRLGNITAADSARFAVACGESAGCWTDPEAADFEIHPMYVVSLLRGGQGVGDREVRPDGMYRDEVPGVGDDALLLAGGQQISWRAPVRAGMTLHVARTVDSVVRKSGGSGSFLLITVHKTFADQAGGIVAEVAERFIVR